MGRYDNIKVYHNGQWKTPNEIKAYNGTNWYSLGTQEGENQTRSVGGVRHLYKQDGTRITKEKNWRRVTGEKYNSGYTLNPGQKDGTDWRYMWAPRTYNTNHVFSGTFRKTAAVDQNLFYCQQIYKPPNDYNTKNGIWITWFADGKIGVRTAYEGTITPWYYFGVTLNTNVWYAITLTGTTDNKIILEVTGVYSETSSRAFNPYLGVNKEQKLGDTYIQMKGNVRMYMGKCNTNGIAHGMSDITIDMSRNTGYSGLTYTDTSYDEAYWT